MDVIERYTDVDIVKGFVNIFVGAGNSSNSHHQLPTSEKFEKMTHSLPECTSIPKENP